MGLIWRQQYLEDKCDDTWNLWGTNMVTKTFIGLMWWKITSDD